jgi:hypothetical protein
VRGWEKSVYYGQNFAFGSRNSTVPLVAECESFYIIFTYLCYERWFLEKTTENQKITVFLSTKWKTHYLKNIVGGFYNHDCPEKIADKRRPTIYNKCIYIYFSE